MEGIDFLNLGYWIGWGIYLEGNCKSVLRFWGMVSGIRLNIYFWM